MLRGLASLLLVLSFAIGERASLHADIVDSEQARHITVPVFTLASKHEPGEGW